VSSSGSVAVLMTLTENHHHHQFIYQPVQVTKKSNTKQPENILAKWPTQGLKKRLRVASKMLSMLRWKL